MRRRVLAIGWLFLTVSCAQVQAAPDQHREARMLIAGLEADLKGRHGEITRRQRLMLQLSGAREADIDEGELRWLSGQVENNPDDLFGKFYEGYGWLLMARRYLDRQNHFRAAELAKRGFFLIDEAVETQPENWRLRLLRVRVDVATPQDFGRHVVALADLGVLEADPAVPLRLHIMLDFLRLKASAQAGLPEEVARLRAKVMDSPFGELIEDEGPWPVGLLEIEELLKPALESDDV